MSLSQQKYTACMVVMLRHPKDDPPPRGSKILTYNHITGITITGIWSKEQHLWAPMPGVDDEMKARLDKEIQNEIYERSSRIIRPRWLKDE